MEMVGQLCMEINSHARYETLWTWEVRFQGTLCTNHRAACICLLAGSRRISGLSDLDVSARVADHRQLHGIVAQLRALSSRSEAPPGSCL